MSDNAHRALAEILKKIPLREKEKTWLTYDHDQKKIVPKR